MKRNWLHVLAAVVVVGSLLLAACQPTGGAETEEPETPPTVATFSWTQEFDTLNPLYSTMWFTSITFQLWNCYAWDFDDQNNPVPVLVTEMPSVENGGISADGTVITLHLRDDLVWSDGEPLTAADFQFTYDMTVDPNNTVSSVYPNDQFTMETPDERTVVMTFAEPFAPWMGILWHGILPQHILQPVYDEAGTLDSAEWNLAPTVGCGPYNFVEWESGSFARFVANDNYWLGAPNIDEVFFRFVPDDAAQVAALKAGEADLGTFIAYSDMPDLEAAGMEIIMVFSGYDEVIYFYLGEDSHPALQDVRVRQAIAMGIDRWAICNDLLLGRTEPAVSYWDGQPWVDPELEPWPYDSEAAAALLDEAGWVDSDGDGVRDKDGVALELDYGTTTREIRRDTQAVVQQQLAAIGVKVNLLNYDSDIYFGSYGENGPAATGQLDMFEYSTVAQFPDPNSADFLCSEVPSDEYPAGANWSGFCDEELDALFQQQQTQVDFAARQQTFWQISRMMRDKAYIIGLWQDPDAWVVSGRLENVRLSGATPFYNIREWDVTQ